MEQRTWRWTDAHFCSLPSQTSIYGCTKILNNINGTNKLLVASLVGRFFTIEYQRIFDKLTPSTKEVQFTYIPGESEIVSVDATNKCRHGKGLTIGITFWKLEENECKQFLHTYSAAQPDEEFNMESVAQGCQSLQLSFMPFHLTHTELVVGNYMESVFLLSGSDRKIHVYREVGYRHSYKEANCEEFFPEFKDLPSIVLWLDILYFYDYKRRITVTGHQDGVLRVSVVDVTKREILQSFSVEFDNPITYVETFTQFNKVSRPSFLPQTDDGEEDEDDLMPVLNILVLSALVPATVYRDVLHNGLKDPLFLPDSNKFDAVLTGCIIDIDFDGENEILIGTYGQEVLAYKLKSPVSTLVHSYSVPETELCIMDTSLETKPRHSSGDGDLSTTPRLDSHASRRVKSHENLSSSVSSETDYVPLSSSKDTVIASNQFVGEGKNGTVVASYRLLWQRSFACPVMGINRLDIMGDGMEDLVIVTLKGLHILQPDLNEVAKVCLERLRLLADSVTTEEKDDDITKDSNVVSETVDKVIPTVTDDVTTQEGTESTLQEESGL